MVSEQVMEAFRMEQEQQSMFKEMQQILVVMLSRLDQYLGNPTRLDQTVGNQIKLCFGGCPTEQAYL